MYCFVTATDCFNLGLICWVVCSCNSFFFLIDSFGVFLCHSIVKRHSMHTMESYFRFLPMFFSQTFFKDSILVSLSSGHPPRSVDHTSFFQAWSSKQSFPFIQMFLCFNTPDSDNSSSVVPVNLLSKEFRCVKAGKHPGHAGQCFFRSTVQKTGRHHQCKEGWLSGD